MVEPVKRRLGVMGGTFDPVHHGHLVAASEVSASHHLDEVVFVPTGQPWQKHEDPVTPAEHRYLMTVIATAANPRFTVSRVDIDRAGTTYTIDTLRDLRAQRGPDVDLFFITGADALAQILSWKAAEELFSLARFIGVTRPGHALSTEGLPADRVSLLEVPAMAISSRTSVREPGAVNPSGISSRTVSCSTSPSTGSTPPSTGRRARRHGVHAVSGRHRKADVEPLEDPATPPAQPTAPPAPPTAPTAPPTRAARTAPPTAPAGPTAAPAATVIAHRDRAAERNRRKAAARRRNVIVLGAGGVAVLAAVLATFLMTRGGEEPTDQVSTGPPKQHTLLVQVTGDDGVAAANALVGVTPKESSAAVVLVPSRLLVDVAGTGSLPFGETVTLPERSAPAQALTDLLGVRVDDSWVLTERGLADVVDAVGGVQADVDVDIVETGADDKQTIVARAGSQRLGGPAAASYATYLAEDEPEQARLARFDDVFSAVVAALPQDRAEITAAVQTAGDGSQSTLDDAGLAARLSGVRAASAAGTLVSDVLPVTEIDTGDTVASYGLDSGEVAAMMRSLLPGALQTDAGGEVLRVLVENGVGTPGLVELARAKLVADGFRFVNGGNAADFGFAESAVIIPDGTEVNVRRGQRVAASLGLPESAVTTSDRGQTVADVIVILGQDFVP